MQSLLQIAFSAVALLIPSHDHGTPVQGFWFDWEFARIMLAESGALIAPASGVH